MVRTRGMAVKEGTVTQINTDSLRVVGNHGASCQLPFAGIEEMAPVGDVTQPLDTLATRHVYEFAKLMAREDHVRIETADNLIIGADICQLFLSGVTAADRFDDGIHFKDIMHVSSVSSEASSRVIAHRSMHRYNTSGS